MSDKHDEGTRTGTLIVGVLLLFAGLWALGNITMNQFGILEPIRATFEEARTWAPGIALVVIGIVVLTIGSHGGFQAPAAGTKLYRSRENKMVAGVLGGLADYFSIDVTLLRLVFVALVLIGAGGGLIVAYIIAAIVIPYPPQPPADVTQP